MCGDIPFQMHTTQVSYVQQLSCDSHSVLIIIHCQVIAVSLEAEVKSGERRASNEKRATPDHGDSFLHYNQQFIRILTLGSGILVI